MTQLTEHPEKKEGAGPWLCTVSHLAVLDPTKKKKFERLIFPTRYVIPKSWESLAIGQARYIGDDKLPKFYGDYFINHDIRIPINQPVFHGK